MLNWCENNVLIQGLPEEIKRYKNRLLKDPTGKYYPWISKVPLPEFSHADEVEAYIEEESGYKTILEFGNRVICLEVIENNPKELELNFKTAYSRACNLCPDDLSPHLSILHNYFNPDAGYQGFEHYMEGRLITSGYEDNLDQFAPWTRYFYNPWSPDLDPLKEKIMNYIADTWDQLHEIQELIELLEKYGPM